MVKVYLIGVGLGNPDTLTVAARDAISACPVVVGAPRLLEPYGDKICAPLIAAADIFEFIKGQTAGPVGVLLSGDVGFYSGAKNLWPLLSGYEVETIPGISSLVYFCAKLQTPWQDARLVSAHGRSHNAVGEIQRSRKTFVLTGGQTKAGDLCRELTGRGLGDVLVSVGENLSYPEERIVTAPASVLAGETFDDLSVLLAVNESPVDRARSVSGIPDGDFLRGEAPMTKEEVRTVSLSKLRLMPHHVLWDVGAGTGSVSVEGALAVPAGRVFAVEKKPEALALLAENKVRFAVSNLTPVAGTAPEALADLPAPDRVFLGGTSGNLEEILRIVFSKNPAARVVVNAVTLETLAETARVFELLGLKDVDMVQVAVTKTRDVGRYHMLNAQNPVWILSGEGEA
ncbi:MAG: precorrin-6y C5,15-methyltransferase (decarboxylating) subunit CbiE [Clostridia bacterium]|nr:precorrin-6y C5,15-methyltransferase (decarboxylating) subunit CbiE [Clostridia bacterium]